MTDLWTHGAIFFIFTLEKILNVDLELIFVIRIKIVTASMNRAGNDASKTANPCHSNDGGAGNLKKFGYFVFFMVFEENAEKILI